MQRQIKGRKICIICEGDEEKDYINALISKNVFNDKYTFADPINAKSINNIYIVDILININQIHMIWF